MPQQLKFRALEHIAGLTLLAVAFLLLGACARSEDPAPNGVPMEAVTGSVTYRERIALSDAAVVEVELVDVSVADGPATVVSTLRIRSPGQVPVHFKLEYQADRIDPTHRYTVQARIREGDTLAFATDTAYPVITADNPRIVEVVVVPIGSAGSPDAEGSGSIASEPPLEGTLAAGDITATYAAHFSGSNLISIQEDRDLGALGRAGAEYQFKEGRLLRYIELGTRATPGGRQQVEFDFAFDDTGELLAARKMVDAAAIKPDLAEIDAARNRADLLRNHALALRASREHTR